MTGRGNSPELIGEGLDVGASERARFITSRSVDLVADSGWPRRHFHDFTIHSRAVQSNVLDGGLKRDLSSWLESEGTIPGHKGLPGIDDETPMLAQLGGDGLLPAGPTMGLLRDWASATVAWTGNNVATVAPETVEDPDSEDHALANENPVRLTDTRRSNLQPILVEATNYMQISTFETVPPDPADEVAYQLRHHIYPRVVLWNPYMGSYYFSVTKTTFGPGECLVFSPAQSAEYDGLSTCREGPYDLAANELSCEVVPDPSRSFHVSGSD